MALPRRVSISCELTVRHDPCQGWKGGYIQHIDVQALRNLAQEQEVQIYVQVVPGSFVTLGETIAEIHGAMSADFEARLHAAFFIGVRRTFEHDPRFGLSVLSEIASRALSRALPEPSMIQAPPSTWLAGVFEFFRCWLRNEKRNSQTKRVGESTSQGLNLTTC